MSTAFVFPGQNSQSVGMLAGWSHQAAVREVFAIATATLGYDLWELTQSGPEDRLNSTEFTQPAMLAAGVAVFRLWRARGGALPEIVSGHSLGEFSALVCAEALELAAALELVRERGRLMQAAVPSGAGAMAAVLGLDDEQVRAACAAAAQGAVVEAVNFNAPGQVVIAGERAAVSRAVDAARQLGAKKVVELSVSVPSHSALMRDAAVQLGERLERVAIERPRIRYLSAVDAAPHEEPDDIRRLLVRQLCAPVRWVDTVRALLERGATELIECGPGKVLTALNKRIARGVNVQCLAVEDDATLDAALTAASGSAGPGSPAPAS